MTMQLDDFGPEEKRQYVLVGVTIGLVLAIVSTLLRTWAKLISIKRLQGEDHFMFAALLLCIGTASCLFYGLTTGLGQHEDTLTEIQMKNFRISVWVIQRVQPPSLFCVKTSLIMFYVRIFPTRAIRIAGWGIWIYTLLLLIGVWFATLFECRPIAYFWNKTTEGGRCIANPLVTIGLTAAVLSCIGDIFIFAMPIPVVLGLNINNRKKAALAGIFAVGLFVIITSFVRWVALLTTKSDITFNQVEAGVWTFLEISIGITCGNLPLLLPLVRSWFSTGDTSRGYHAASDSQRSGGAYTPHMPTQRTTPKKPNPYSGFMTLNDSPEGSEVELRNRNDREKGQGQSVSGDSVGASSNGLGPEVTINDIGLAVDRPDGGIMVQTRVDVQYDDGEWRGMPDKQRNLIIRDMLELIDPYFRNENSQALSHMHRELADDLVDRYLQTTESVYRVIHIPAFKEQYRALWDSPEAKRDQFFLVQLKLILALGAITYDDSFSLRSQATRWIYEAQTFLCEPIFKPRLRIQMLQSQILLIQAKELVDVAGDSIWISAGSLIRTAITMGLHRDPSHLPKMEPLAAEMRRRLWNTILELSLQASMAKGCPPLISLQDFDTQSPLNVKDEDLTTLPAEVGYEKLNNGLTQVSVANALRHTFPVRLKVVRFLNDLDPGTNTYEEALKLDFEVRSKFKELRQRLQTCIPDKPLSSSLPRPSLAIQAVSFIMHRYLSSLHMPFFGVSLHEAAYAFSRKVVVDTSLKIWSAAWPSSCINSADPAATVTEDDTFSRLVRNGSGFFRTVVAQAAYVIPAELRAQLQEDQGLGPTPLRQDLIAVTDEAKTWCLRCIEAGETSAKGHLLASIMAALVEGQRRGLGRDELGRFLVETVERSGETCLPILEDLERKSRSEDTKQGMDAVRSDEEGHPGVLPGLTEDWNFTIPDTIFANSDGSIDWSLGEGTMQGLSFW
ncbi:hypothetical protein VMCG_08895 [Cytospora schulzeri]|uniref:Xylanolytic transcriptional activator regulatory domain-containing protein n=1 Tax=Cytospora schulzeri TaxID=448051 RepID=A0A423VUI8_9PEZI|nr:hypothetical protein VMCG_08895 [Valsa malicola]